MNHVIPENKGKPLLLTEEIDLLCWISMRRLECFHPKVKAVAAAVI